MKKNKRTILYICIIGACLALAACGKKKKDKTDDITPMPTPTPTPTATVTPTTTPTPEVEEPVDVNYISEEEAISKIKNAVGERGYTFELLDDHLTVGENQYYIFQISDSSSVIEPNVLVDKVSGELFCYYKDGGIGAFEEHPLLTKPNLEEETSSGFTKEDALVKLSKVPNETLNLPAPLSEYSILFDDWTTIVNGVECYGINVFAEVKDNNKINMGLYYVAVDGSVMFQYDSLSDDFVEIE